MKSLKGEEVDLERYKGKVLLIVNTASECGLTPQYEQLQAMHKEYKDKGLVILGFPCNQFGQQEPGTAAEISNFCQENYGVEFSMFSKIDVNGEKQAPLYEYLKAEAPLKENGKKVSAEKNVIRWNFEKFVVDKNGKVAERFSPGTKPDSDEVLEVIRQELAE
ncbi:MAG: glutathione peroxidase [Fuerstiella sp.]|nr:glutathione peroxidase [Fuerstiella sp.]